MPCCPRSRRRPIHLSEALSDYNKARRDLDALAEKRMIAKAAEKGLQLKSGVECEFFLISQAGSAISDAADRQSKPCYDQSALMRRYDIISEISDCMLKLGWDPYQSDHEDANGQFEMNWGFDDALVTADRHAFL
jgi:glutamate---methylamine ligase